MTTLPEGWDLASLSDVASWGSGGTPQAGHAAFYGGDIPWAIIGDLNDATVLNTRASITDAGLAGSSAKLAPEGAVLIAMYGSIGKLGIAGRPMATNQAIAFAVPNRRVLVKYLFYYLMSQRHELDAAGKGATQRNISQTILRSWPILFPEDLDEQRRIVDMLEDLLSRLDAAGSDSAAAEIRVAQWQRSIMLRAILGGSGDPADSIGRHFELAGPLAPDIPLPLGWRWSKWRDIGSSQNGQLFPSSDYSQEGIRLLRPGNMGANGSLTWTSSATRRLPVSYASSHAAMLLMQNDLVMNLTAQSLRDDFLGRVCLVGREDSSLLNQRIARLRTSELTPGFALIVFRSPLFREHVKTLNTGSLIQHMFTKQINEFWLPVPPKEVQDAVAAEVGDKLAAAMRTTDAVDVVKGQSRALRRSLLAAAFSGRLTGRASDLEMVEEMAGV